MKAKLVALLAEGDRIYEVKFDGYRDLALRGDQITRLLSRNETGSREKNPRNIRVDDPLMFTMRSSMAKLWHPTIKLTTDYDLENILRRFWDFLHTESEGNASKIV